MLALLLVISSLSATVRSAQPEAPAPIAAPLRELPWAQLNFLHTTDTHGWHGGHLQEPQYSADWGDYISFSRHLRDRADAGGKDVILIDTGDRIEGNGLYDASEPKGKYTFDIFKQQDIDIICSGNHELYLQNSSENELHKTVPNFRANYLASNLDIYNPDTQEFESLAPRYKKFETQNQGIRILAFGFVYDFQGNANNTVVRPVEDTINEQWFQDAIRQKDVDLIVVIGHVSLDSKEYNIIYRAIREVQWDTPLQFFGGHTHIRDYRKYDRYAYGIESGRYMETIGFMSIDGLNKAAKTASDTATVPLKFDRRYIDNNLFSLHHHSGKNGSSFPTDHGKYTSKLIADARHALDLNSRHGCAPRDYWVNRAPFPHKHSIFSLLQDEVLPEQLIQQKRTHRPTMVITNTGAIRFDIFKGVFSKDTTYLVSPFTSGLHVIEDVPYSAATQLRDLLNSEGPMYQQAGPVLHTWMLASPEQISVRKAVAVGRNKWAAQSSNQVVLAEEPDLSPGYTTRDDMGDDGDDTLHSPIKFYTVPNVIQANISYPADGKDPEKVDVIYNEFIEYWIIAGLNFLGQEYDVGSTAPYMEGRSFTDIFSDWVEKNWRCDAVTPSPEKSLRSQAVLTIFVE